MRQIVLDTETTGLEPELGHRIIEIGCVELVNRRHTGRTFHHYLNPDRDIDKGALEVHGITLEQLQNKPRFADVADELMTFICGAELVIHNAAFDVAFMARQTISLGFLARSVALRSGRGAAGVARLEEAFASLRIREFVYGGLVIQRHRAPRPGFTVRRQRSLAVGEAALPWLLRWETELASRGSEWLLDTRPVASPTVEFVVTHRMVDGELTPIAYRMQTDQPLDMEARAAPWMGALIARCDGRVSAREHFASLKEAGAFPELIGPDDFARVLGQLVSGGFIWIPGFEPGTRPRQSSMLV